MIAALDDQTNHTYGDLMTMPYADVLVLNLDVQAYLTQRKELIEEKRDQL